jgi:hypothetical protein
MSFVNSLMQKYNAAKMNDPRFPHIAVEVPVPEKTHKYKRFAHEKRAKPTPGMKRIQTPHIMVTKWDVEIANKRNKKIGRARDREDKYGDWSENRTDTMWEDEVNKAANDATKQRVQYMARRERTRKVIRSSLAEYGELMFPTYSLYNRGGWAAGVWESYGEYLEYNPAAREREKAWQTLIHSPEQIDVEEPNEGDFVCVNLN